MADSEQWFQLLQIDQPDEEQRELLEQVIAQIDNIFNTATFNENNTSGQESVFIDDNNLEELARVLLSCKELRAEFANQVSSLTLEAKRGLESESS